MRSRNESEDLEAAEIILALTSMRSHSKVQEERHFMLDDQLEASQHINALVGDTLTWWHRPNV